MCKIYRINKCKYMAEIDPPMGLREVTGSGVGRMGESRWMMVYSQIVVNRHRCLSGCPSGCPSRHLSGVGCQGFGLVDTRKECFLGRGTEMGIHLKVDEHAGEP